MSESIDQLDLEPIARKVIASLTDHSQIPVFSGLVPSLNLEDAYRVTSLLRAAFESRGEEIIGRKIGFTNRDMWDAHGVQAPIWGYCTDRTTHNLKDAPIQSVSDFVEPHIEPEIIFGLKEAPSPNMDAAELLNCIDWISLGYEVVQSIYPHWEFAASDTVAANALHGTLLIGERRSIARNEATWEHELATFNAELYCDGTLCRTGGGALVLDSPLNALHHLVKLLAADPNNPPLRSDEIVSTGTLTLAMPVSAGQTWTTKVEGIALQDITLHFEP